MTEVIGSGPWRVTVIESERGWGMKVDQYRRFPTKEAAVTWANNFNKDNPTDHVPDWYMQANDPEYVP